jgi:VWFA-related protein
MRNAILISLLAFTAASSPQATPSSQSGNAPAGSQQPETVLRANTRLVMVDVVATNNKGVPVTDLKPEEFTIAEDGKLQKIGSFNFQNPEGSPDADQDKLPKNVVSNVPRGNATGLNVILLDRINGESRNQVYAQDRLVKFLESGKPVQPTAVFVLDKKLAVVHDFTTDTAALKDALNKVRPGGVSRVSGVEVLASPFATRGDFHTNETTIESTLGALMFMAKYLAGYPGRKNLIWVSEAFPVSLMIDGAAGNSNANVVLTSRMSLNPSGSDLGRSMVNTGDPKGAKGGRTFQEELARIADALMDAHVALYPVDASGMGQADRLWAQTNMQDMADRTGGRAFYNRNDIEVGIRLSVDDGSIYYGLSYYPENHLWDGRFRKIEIKTTRPGVSLRYRMGYYAIDPSSSAKIEMAELSQEFSRALAWDAPSFAALRFQATINPPADKTQKWTVSFAIDPHSVSFEPTQDGLEHAAVSCAVAVYSDTGSPTKGANNDITTMTAALPPDQYQKMMAKSFPCKRSLELKSGKYLLRLAAMDKNSRSIGATTTPLTVD